MSKTNALPDPHSIVRSPGFKPSSTPASISALSQDDPCLKANEELEFGASEIAALRAFFELLAQWDRNEIVE